MASVSLDEASLRQLSSVNDVTRLLHEARVLERGIEQELDSLLSRGGELEDVLTSLETSTANVLEKLHLEAEHLAASTKVTASLGDRVSGKIRRLDLAQSQARRALKCIDAISDRTQAVAGASKALETENYDLAAQNIGIYLNLSTAEVGNDPTLQILEQEQLFFDIRDRVEQAIRHQGMAAVNRKDHAQVAHFSKLFAPLKLQQEGMELLLTYLRDIISERAKADYDALIEVEGGFPDYLGTLTNLFKDIAEAISEHVEELKYHFGPDLTLAALYGFHAECDIHGTRLVQRYIDHRKLQRLCSQIGVQREGGASNIEPRQIEGLLEEMLVLSSRSEEYTRYLLTSMAGAVAPGPLPPSRETALRSSSFHSAVRELTGYYLSLEEYYLEASVTKALQIDQLEPGALTSSMVDDVFYILLKAGRRAMATAKVPSAVAILNQLNSVLSTIYRSALGSGLQGMGGNFLSNPKAAVALNNAQTSSEYTTKLQVQLTDLAGTVFQSADRERIKLVLADLGKTAADLTAMTLKAVQQAGASVMPSLGPWMDLVSQTSYDVGLNGSCEGDSWAYALLAAIVKGVESAQLLLTSTNFEAVTGALLDAVARRLEAVILQKRFTLVGSLQLERDVRLLVNGLSEQIERGVRERFGRLSQLSSVLAVESGQEAMELLAEGGWRLSESEVRSALDRRLDLVW